MNDVEQQYCDYVQSLINKLKKVDLKYPAIDGVTIGEVIALLTLLKMDPKQVVLRFNLNKE